MNNEIKEILDDLDYCKNRQCGNILLKHNECDLLLDYITNLQTIEQQYSAILSENAELENKITNLQEENERLKEMVDWNDKVANKKQEIIDKATGFINAACSWLNIDLRDDDELLEVKVRFFKDLLNILEGEENER